VGTGEICKGKEKYQGTITPPGSKSSHVGCPLRRKGMPAICWLLPGKEVNSLTPIAPLPSVWEGVIPRLDGNEGEDPRRWQGADLPLPKKGNLFFPLSFFEQSEG